MNGKRSIFVANNHFTDSHHESTTDFPLMNSIKNGHLPSASSSTLGSNINHTTQNSTLRKPERSSLKQSRKYKCCGVFIIKINKKRIILLTIVVFIIIILVGTGVGIYLATRSQQGGNPEGPVNPGGSISVLPREIDKLNGIQNNSIDVGPKVNGEEDCRQLALQDSQYVAWGFRTANHWNESARSTCFFYRQGFLPYAGNSSDFFHVTGCLRPNEKVIWGCKTTSLVFKRAEETRFVGGNSGTEAILLCPEGSHVSGFYGNAGAFVDGIGVVCSNGRNLGTAGGRGGNPFSIENANGFKELVVRTGFVTPGVAAIYNIKFGATREVGGLGEVGPYALSCEDKIMGLRARGGAWLDGIAVICGKSS